MLSNILPNELRNNKEVVLEAVKQNGYALEYASKKLRADKEFILALMALRQSGWALEYTSAALKADKEVVMAAVQKRGRALQYASVALKAGQGGGDDGGRAALDCSRVRFDCAQKRQRGCIDGAQSEI